MNCAFFYAEGSTGMLNRKVFNEKRPYIRPIYGQTGSISVKNLHTSRIDVEFTLDNLFHNHTPLIKIAV